MHQSGLQKIIRKAPMWGRLRNFYSDFVNQVMMHINGRKDYTRFIILSRSRTGSNFLRGLLNAHSQVIVYSEVFKDDQSIEWGFPGYNDSMATLSLFQSDPVGFLEKKVFSKYPRKIRAVGFKLFYYHARNPQWCHIWPYLQEASDIRIIHLKRRNILETHLSRQRAIRTNKWANISGEREEPLSLTINYDECLQDFIQTREWERENDLNFRNHLLLEVYYEDLSREYQREIQKVQEFLGLGFEPVAPITFKQAVLPLSKSIANYADLKEKFSGTAWEEFFTDD